MAKVRKAVLATFVAMLMTSACYAVVQYYSNIITTPPVVYGLPYYGQFVYFNKTNNYLNATFNFTVNEPKSDANFALAILANTTINKTYFTEVNVTISNSTHTTYNNMTLKNWDGHNSTYGHILFPNAFNKTGYTVTFNVLIGLNTTIINNQTVTLWLNAWIDNGQEPPQYYSPPIE